LYYDTTIREQFFFELLCILNGTTFRLQRNEQNSYQLFLTRSLHFGGKMSEADGQWPQFVGRLEKIQDHSDKPLTSTPLIMPSKIFSQRDVQSCFGFDDEKADSDPEAEIFDENQLSSICKEKVNIEPMRRSPLRPENAQFNSLLVRYGMLEEKDKKEIPKTYTKKKPIVTAKRNVIFGETPKTKRRNPTKNSKKTKAKSDENTDAKPKKQARQKKKKTGRE